MLEIERFTSESKKVLILAHKEALRNRQDFIQTHHLLLSLAILGEIVGGVAYKVLVQNGVGPHRIQDAISIIENKGENLEDTAQMSIELKKALSKTIDIAINLKKQHMISPEHILLGILDTGGNTQEFLDRLDINPKVMREKILQMLEEK